MHRILRRSNAIFATALLIAATVTQTNAQQGGAKGPDGAKGALKGAAPGGRGGLGAQPPLGSTPKPAIPNAKPVRTCESWQ